MLPSLDRRARLRLLAPPGWWVLGGGCLLVAVAGLVLLVAVAGGRPADFALTPLVLVPVPGSMVVSAIGWPAGWLIGLGLAVPAAVVLCAVVRRRR